MCQNTWQHLKGGRACSSRQSGAWSSQPRCIRSQETERDGGWCSAHALPCMQPWTPAHGLTWPTFRVGLPLQLTPFWKQTGQRLCFHGDFWIQTCWQWSYSISVTNSSSPFQQPHPVSCVPHGMHRSPQGLWRHRKEGTHEASLRNSLTREINRGNRPPFKRSMRPPPPTTEHGVDTKIPIHLESPLCHSFFLPSGKQIKHN